MITTATGFADVVAALRDQPRYALDTEFHRERTYFPRLALVQLAWDGGLVLVDPLTVDIAPLAEVLAGPGTAVLHAATQDLEVLELACGTVPQLLFDTQIAAGFVGMSSPSLSELHDRRLGKALPKGDRLTDWLRRPLSDDQLRYAASDVAELLHLQDILSEELERRGRLPWAAAECALLVARARGGRDPELAYLRIKEVRQLRGKALGVAKAVAAWRERRAAQIDQPTRHVLPDLAVAGIAQRAPATLSELRKVRGVEDRHLRGVVGEELLAAVIAGAAAPAPTRPTTLRTEVPRELRAAVGLLSAWVTQLARDLELDATLLATRSDLEDFLRNDADARLAVGWRAELVGDQIRQLLEGEAALAFDGHGRLVIEARSRRSL
ncbi:MAG: HRDC domain-containing protein [Acidimicrobiales bacterium]|nr:HRDC domain-containing protein [Acidimicrobiales bacterium]